MIGHPAADEDRGAVLVYEGLAAGANTSGDPGFYRGVGVAEGDALGDGLLVADIEGGPADEIVVGAPNWDQAADTDAGAIFLIPGWGF